MTYVFDANALLAIFYVEPGAATLHKLLEETAAFHIHALNLCEVLYGLIREEGQEGAQLALAKLLSFGFQVRPDMDDALWQDAAAIKANNKLSLADAFAVALTRKVDGELITSDHHELDSIAAAGICRITFFR